MRKSIHKSFFLGILALTVLLVGSCEKDEEPEQFKLTTVISPAEGGSISISEGSFDSGEEVTLTARPSEGFAFINWSGAVSGTENPVKVVFNADKSISANFEKTDADADGVPDDVDECSGTAAGETVNEEGCAPSQKDTDGDGVTDDIDICSETPAGVTVDETGCSDNQKDSDGDGVLDEVDNCSETPNGETVDETGCSDSQKDTDNDGVADNLDTCADTPEGETADESGCSSSQKDTDGDGVTDDKDLCPDTGEGETVNEEGCKLVARTFVPDDYFEQQLIDLGIDDVLDDYVDTENIISLETLALNGLNQSDVDLTGLEDFVSLTSLFISSMTTESIDLGNHPLLQKISLGFSRVGELVADSHENLEEISNRGSTINSATLTDCPKLSAMPSSDSYYNNLVLIDIPLLVELGGIDDTGWGDVIVEDCALFEGFIKTSIVRSLEFINCDSVRSLNINYVEGLLGFPIQNITLTKNENLTEIDVRNATLASLVINEGNAISSIKLEGNLLKELNVSTLANLENLVVQETDLGCIQVSQEQLDAIPATWSVNGSDYSTDCAQ